MSDIAIRVDNLSKRYRIGCLEGHQYYTLRDTLANVARAPLRWMRGRGSRGEEPEKTLWV